VNHQEVFNKEETYDSLDNCLDVALKNSDDLFSVAQLVRGHQQSQPSPKKQKTKDVRPLAYVRFNSRLGKAKPITLRCLLDTGASGSLIAAKHATKLRAKELPGQKTVWTTPGGELTTSKKCQCTFLMPEFHRDRVIEWDINISSMDLGAHDMIIGRDILQGLGIKFDFTDLTIEWDGAIIPMRDADSMRNETFYIHEPDSIVEATERIKNILDAKYEKADLSQVVKEATHLSDAEQGTLHTFLSQYEDLFDGTLGKWNMGAYDIELLPDAKPYHARAYPIPQIHTATLKLEVDRLCKAGVLKKVNQSEWAAPTFIIPKKDGSVRFISDFRELNKRIKRKPFPIPRIQDMLLKLEGFQYATSLDLNMGYYHIELSPHSKRLCTIVLPWGKYEYQRLPMGLCNSPDIFQEKMSSLMQDLEYVRAYIDDLLVITTDTLKDHLDKLGAVLTKLRQAGLKVNVKKSFFAKTELEYLGYWITREGISPTTSKVNAITNIAPPTNKKQLRSFIGMVNYYRDMWIRRSHVLAPLAALTSKTAKWQWGPEEQTAFDTMKRIIGKETLLAYPDFTKEFTIHTDASHTQLGAVISQGDKPIAFYSRKLKPEQTRYTTTERELLSIVETLKEFRNILLGQRITIFTDHQNLTWKNFNTERVMRWRLILEEYGPTLKYIKGEHNIVADALSRMDMVKEPIIESLPVEEAGALFAGDKLELDFPNDFPLSYEEIQHRQTQDADLQKQFQAQNSSFVKSKFPFGDKEYELITKEDKIVLPRALQRKAVQWYHSTLLHPGETRTELTMSQHYTWKGMRKTIEDVCKRCSTCQLTKPKLRQVGHLPPKEPEEIPWERLCIDLIGPYTIGAKCKSDELTLHCLTMIDPATGWFEIAEIPAKTADVVMDILERTWLVRYPRPTEIIMDRGREFMAEVQNSLKHDYGIRRKLITTRNPQANAMVERAHQTLHNMLATLNIRGRQDLDSRESWDGILSAVAFAMRATVHTTTRATPMQLVFGRDAIHNIRFQADWQYIKERRRRLILQNNERENARRTPHTYHVGDQVMIEMYQHRKYGQAKYAGPYEIDRVNENGTVRLRQATANGGAVYRTWNIRNIFPYKA
jgi:transposase InsO family protein